MANIVTRNEHDEIESVALVAMADLLSHGGVQQEIIAGIRRHRIAPLSGWAISPQRPLSIASAHLMSEIWGVEQVLPILPRADEQLAPISDLRVGYSHLG